MRKFIAGGLLLLGFYHCRAQTWDEWFRQRKTQIRYLEQQIVALQVYIELAQKTYKIADEGLSIIGKIKDGDFNLHRDFFGALRTVKPAIANSSQVTDMAELQVKMIQLYDRIIKNVRRSEWLSAGEVKYIERVYHRLLQSAADKMDELFALITSDQYELSDDERIRRIDGLHKDMLEEYGFVHWFSDQSGLIVTNRQKENQDGLILKSLILQK